MTSSATNLGSGAGNSTAGGENTREAPKDRNELVDLLLEVLAESLRIKDRKHIYRKDVITFLSKIEASGVCIAPDIPSHKMLMAGACRFVGTVPNEQVFREVLTTWRAMLSASSLRQRDP